MNINERVRETAYLAHIILKEWRLSFPLLALSMHNCIIHELLLRTPPSLHLDLMLVLLLNILLSFSV